MIARSVLAAAVLTLVATSAAAQVSPAPNFDPGAALREGERNRQRLEEADRAPPAPDAPIADTVKRPGPNIPAGAAAGAFVLRGVRFTPSAFLSEAELSAAVRPFVGAPIDAAGLRGLTAAVNALYDAKGIVTGAAIVPAQDVADGVLDIRLVEGRLGELKVPGASAWTEDYLRRRLPLKPGEVIDLPRLDRDILLFNRTEEARIQGALRAGQQPGFTDLDLVVQEPRRDEVLAFVDNQGNDYTNRHELGLLARRFSVFTEADKLSAFAAWSDGSVQWTLGYELPIGRRGDRLGVSYAENDIDIVAGPFRPLDIEGQSHTGSLTYRSMILATDEWMVGAHGQASFIRSDTSQAGKLFSHDEVERAGLGVSLTYVKPRYVLALTQDVSAVHARGELLPRREFLLANGQASADYQLGRGFSLEGLAVWQLSPEERLPAVLTLQIGGPTTVRGYPTSALSGDQGAYASVTARKSFPWLRYNASVFAFMDAGYVSGGAGGDAAIASLGLGSAWMLTDRVTFEFAAAAPLKDAPAQPEEVRVLARLTARLF